MVTMHWSVLVLIIFLTIIAYTFIFLLAYRAMTRGQKGRFLFNLPLAPFSIKSRIYTVAKQVGVTEEEVSYVGDNVFKVNDERYTVEGFFGVVVYLVDEKDDKVGAIKGEITEFNISNLRHESGEIGEE